MEGGIYNFRRVFLTYSNIFWAYKLFSNISNNNEQDPIGFDQHWGGIELH